MHSFSLLCYHAVRDMLKTLSLYRKKRNARDDSLAGPLRVIDVEKTISNCRSGGIHFARSPTWHVISHTWSADVRAFSCAIGEKLIADLEKKQSYEVLFESAGLQSHAAYQALVDFLVILQTEGVRWVWFDAVCINQTDREEKDHEIQHMGTYYQKAVGCYVVQHGIGKGFELLLDQFDDGVEEGPSVAQPPQIPRWFTRAWTLQEYILPPKVTFILDLASKPHFCMVAFFVLVQAKRTCMCCGASSTISPSLVHKSLLLTQQANGQDIEKNSLCSAMKRLAQKEVCCFKASNDPHFKKVPGRRQCYFSDDTGYAFLLRLKFTLDQMPYDICVEDLQYIRVADADLHLARQIKVKQDILQSSYGKEVMSYSRVIREISVRDCSNPEDRVLSILKLLGVENAVQVRTGKSLQAQLCQFAKSLVDSKNPTQAQELIIHMCMVDVFGSETPGMSWMPQFEVRKGSWQEGVRALALSMFGTETDFSVRDLEIAMRCVTMSDTGMLHFEANVCIGKLVLMPNHPFQKRKTLHGRTDELSRPMVLEVEEQVISYLYAYMHPELAQPTTCVLTNRYVADSHSRFLGEVSIAFQSPGLQYLRDYIPVFLVKIATVPLYANGQVLGLVCVRKEEQGSPFHKIGYLITSRNYFPSSQKMLCGIGGLAKHDLNKLLFNPMESISK